MVDSRRSRSKADEGTAPAAGQEPAADPDAALLALVRQRDTAGLGALYDRHHRVAMALALRMLRDREQAEDAVQDAFLALWRHAPAYGGERGSVRRWLLTIVHQRCVGRLRSPSGPPPAARGETRSAAPDAGPLAVPPGWEEALGPVRQAEVRRALEVLPEEQRRTVQLAYFGGLSGEQIAAQLGLPLGTVKGQMRLALQQLRARQRAARPER